MGVIFSPIVAALNPIAIHLGPIAVHWYGVIIATGVIIAVTLAVREGNRRGIESDDIYDMILWALPAALIAARAYYVIFQWSYYQHHPGEIIAIWDGGIAIYGSLIGAGLVVYFFCRSRFIPVWLMLDVAAPTVILGQAIGRWGNFMNQEAFGRITSLAFLQGLHLPRWVIDQMFINGAYRQPTFLFESTWSLMGFVVLMSLRHYPGLFKQGEVFLAYVMWYSFGRFFIEGMRTDSLMLFSFIRVSQLLSVILFVGALIIWISRRRSVTPPIAYLDGNPFQAKTNLSK
ncbi:MAG: prolipoprotein diacylglyceryl transferase [Levilactobacillus sp.]|jgi:phosphatidylglycerol:prolipoprotein diacylglycerol transferase|uniref:Phosphatidylglycerol--prolipoprotein diacylglyceryl transferase n=1 Tax=Levilactobacillus suantsaiihabitans TaxID=2487722 RepID=A0A4Z0JA32_9LACO|nr:MULTISPECIES: prolipoprotein diacylglyceryl transferase [Levilactobacillus]MCH4124039.1 prolipoprotein diacylglyceryl transferase [Levilactobacillus sp.]MCI1554125.1 prolipoprotein diacylglyceryl transferase [Levilactobacillus sp.]MCI1599329.1 prolipoprotein diacylglyceryl transferase [Levilactobacillus sp.]MCI1605713.1 prolipoprotein diacylglyceryl transferase [Levilactobacillus sp.]TGD19627.1 prolipoprotein diacylglyceryl transferase [Levilactobacillus suantsaiihabitans]